MELFIFNQDDSFITILSKDEGLVDTWFKDYQNHIPDESFIFNIKSNSPLLQHIKEENQVAFYDRDGDLRLVRIKELYEVSTKDGHNIRMKCEPSYLELYDHFIEDKRYVNKTAQNALDGALQGSRYVGEVTIDLGNATDNFYWIDGIGAIFKILGTWGGALKDAIALDDNNEIIERKLWIVQRLGTDNGLIVEPDYNAEQIGRKTLSYIKTALWGQGASLETEGGGYTRYITFEDVEWSKAKGDPVDKPKGQKWVGDPQSLASDGYLHNGTRKHHFGHFSNQDYETPEELLMATWQELQERKLKEIIHEATIYESDKKVSLGDTVTILNRNYNKPIELQSQITGLEYDVLDDKEVTIIVGKYIDMNEDPLQKDVDDLKDAINKPRPTAPITDGSFPDIKPGIPVSIEAHGGIGVIQLYWDYDSQVYISHYEVYGSQIAGFVPDSQHLLYRGRVSSFAHTVDTDQTWYYRIRAVNTRGTASDYGVQVSASSNRVISDDILFGSIIADHFKDGLDIAHKLSDNSIDFINRGPMEAIEYTNQEIIDTENRLLGKLNTEIGDVNTSISDLLDRTSGIEGTVTNVVQDINTIDGKLSTTITQLSNIDGLVSDHSIALNLLPGQLSAKAEKSEVYTRTETNGLLGNKVDTTVYNNKMTALDLSVNGISGRVSNTETNINNLTGEVSSAKSQIATLDIKANQVDIRVSEVRADLDGLEIGGRNLYPNTSSEFKTGTFAGWQLYFQYIPIGGDSPLQIGDEITWSGYIKSGNNVSGIMMDFITDSGGYVQRHGNWIPENSEGKVIGTTKIPANATRVRLALRHNSGSAPNNTIHYKELQIEKGNKATDWTPAPEDMDARVTTLNASITTLAGQVELKASQTSINSLTGRMSNAESSITTNANNIKLKVDEDGVIASINVSKEGIRIAGNKHHITGQTLIDDAVIGTAAIANLAVTNGKIANLAVGTAQIADAAITNAKIHSLNADKINAGAIRGIDIYGAKFRSSAGTDYMEIVGGNIELSLNNGRKLDISPTGFYGYNQGGSIRFQADASLVTSAAFGTSNVNVYLASSASGEARVVDYNSLPAGGNINDYSYNPIRAHIYRFPDLPNGYFTLYNGGEFRFTGESIVGPVYQPLRAAGYYGNFLDARGTVDHLYARPRTSAGELRVTRSGTTDDYLDVRARNFAGVRVGLGTHFSNSTNFYITTAAGGETRFVSRSDESVHRPIRVSDVISESGIIRTSTKGTGRSISMVANGSNRYIFLQMENSLRVTGPGQANNFKEVYAKDFIPSSSERWKTNIEKYEDSALDLFRQSVIYKYYKHDSADLEFGFITERETPNEIKRGDGISSYSLQSLTVRAVQEVDLKFTNKIVGIEDRLNKKDLEIQYLKQKIKQLESAS